MSKPSTLNKALKVLADAVTKRTQTTTETRPPEKYSLEELVSIARRESLSLEERVARSEELMQRAETLYRLDPLIFAGVNKLTRLIATPKLYFTGEQDVVELFEDWTTKIGLKVLLPSLIKDIFIYGYGVAEIVRDGRGKIVKLCQIDPKTLDYDREQDGSIKRDSNGEIVGYVQKVDKSSDSKDFAPEKILILKFYTLGEECLGLSPIEAVFKPSWIRLNLEEAMGEAIYRHGYPLFYYKIGTMESEAMGKGLTTPEKMAEAKEVLKSLDSASELILPWWITPGRLDSKANVGDISNLLQYLAALVLAGLEVPKIYGTTTIAVQGNVGQENLDFEKTIQTMQEFLITQLDLQLFRASGAPKADKLPKLNFTEYTPEQKTLKARRLTQLVRHGALTPDLTLENEIRKSEGLSELSLDDKTDLSCTFYPDQIARCPVLKRKPFIDPKTLTENCKICSLKQRLDAEPEPKKSKKKEE